MLIESILQYRFLQYAYITGIMIAIIFPIFGSFIVLRKQTFISDALSHVSLVGVTIGAYFGVALSPTLFGVIAAVIGAVVIEYLRSSYKSFKELSMMIVMSISIALSVTIVSLSSNTINFVSYLFGNINTISQFEFYTMIVVFILSIIFFFKYYYVIVALSIDEDYAKLRYKNFTVIKYTFTILTALIIALSIKVIGALLIGALIIIPISTVLNFGKSLKKAQFYAIGVASFSVLGGLVISYYAYIPSGAAIVIVSTIIFIITKTIGRFL